MSGGPQKLSNQGDSKQRQNCDNRPFRVAPQQVGQDFLPMHFLSSVELRFMSKLRRVELRQLRAAYVSSMDFHHESRTCNVRERADLRMEQSDLHVGVVSISFREPLFNSMHGASFRFDCFAQVLFRTNSDTGLLQPPAIAPTTRKASSPHTTASGSSSSGEACDKSSPHAKNRINGRRTLLL